MRILIADRNGLLLESIARSFAGQFCIQSATTHEQCNMLLGQSQFDLVVISEKLADGPGLQLLSQIVRNSPDTLRVFAARRSRLELLKGKLGPFGLFRTLSYPINPRELHSLLTLTRSGLETELPAMEVPVAQAAPISEKVTAPAVKPAEPTTPVAVPVVARPSAERISFVRASALFSTNVLENLTGRVDGSLPARTKPMPRPATERPARESQAAAGTTERPARESQAAAGTTERPARVAPPSRPAESHSRARAPEVVQPRPAPIPPPMRLPEQQPEVAPADFWQVIPLPPPPSLIQRAPLRTKLILAATVAAVFLVTTVTMNLMDAGVHVSHASAPASVVEIEPPAVPETPPAAAPVDSTPRSAHPAGEAQQPLPKPDATESKVAPADSRVAASTTPVADPSTFGSEAYEAVYTN